MEGWIKLHRSALDHWLFTEYRPLTRQEAWVKMLLTVNYEPSKVLIKGQLYDCQPGQCLLSLENWAKSFVWSIQQVRTFFKLLESDGMINTEGLQFTTRLTVCNWDVYQGIVTDKKQTKNKPTTNGQQATNKLLTTIKEEEEIKEVKEYKKLLLSEIVISDFPGINNEYFEIAKAFQELFKHNLEQSGASTKTIDAEKGTSIDDIRLIIETDKYNVEDLRSVFTYLKNEIPDKSGFAWKDNIFSTSKLRKQMDKLKIKINAKSRTNHNGAQRDLNELAGILQKHINP